MIAKYRMGISIIWLFLFWPMWMLSTDPQSSPPDKVKQFLPILEESSPPKSEPATPAVLLTPKKEEQPPPVIKKEEVVAIVKEKEPLSSSGPSSDGDAPIIVDESLKPEFSDLSPEVLQELTSEGVEAPVVSDGGGEAPSSSGVPPSPGELKKTDDKRLEEDSAAGASPGSSSSNSGDTESQIPNPTSQVEYESTTEESLKVETVPGSGSASPIPSAEEMQEEMSDSSSSAVTSEDDENGTATGKTEEIPSFSEWTKLQLEQKRQDKNLQLQLQSNGVVRDVKKEDGKNFASPDCGAKILLANPEAQNPSGTISTTSDEYMLNRCGVSSWLIMELCEPIRIEKIAIGNLELFSSSPKDIDVGVSDRYPTREWVKIGPLELPDARATHAFPVNTNSTYSRFVRIQILSHHGNEHYCPLSVIRIYGKSEYEVLDTETAHSNEVGQGDNDSSSLGEETLNNNEGTNEKSVIGTAADAVINIVKKAAQVLGKRGESSSESTKNQTTSCQSVSGCSPNVTEVCNRKLLQFVQANSLYFAENASCRSLLNTKSIGGPSQVEGFWIALFGDGILHSVCRYMSPLRHCDAESDSVDETVNALNGNTTLKSNLTSELNQALPQQTTESPQTVPPETTNNGGGNFEKLLPPVLVMEEESRMQKESVFVRLTNRIKALERNQSLSSGYLEELSQRFKKQSEESYSVSQTLKKTLNETLSKYKWIQEYSRRETTFLRRSVADLRVTLWRTEMQRGFLIFVVLIQFLGVSFFCCWTRRKISHLEDKMTVVARPHVPTPSSVRNPPNHRESQLPIIPRKRSNSHPDMGKLKKKKKKKDLLKNNGENVFTFIPHSITAPDSLNNMMNHNHNSKRPSTPPNNGVLSASNQLNTQLNIVSKYESDTVTVNRFGILASPSSQTINSVGSSNASTNTEGSCSGGPMTKRMNEYNSTTNGHNRSGSSVTSLESTGTGTTAPAVSGSNKALSTKTSKKMKFKHLIPKLFEK